MISLSTVIKAFEADFLEQYQDQVLPSQRQALAALKNCRSSESPVLQVRCSDCDHETFVPHSCGHRSCPHCQHHESQQWLERQGQKQVPARYFMITFTLPAQLRTLAWQQQRILYGLMLECVWATLRSFSLNDQALAGDPGMVAVLHTHSRALDYHPHIHAVMPAAVVDKINKAWRTKASGYLFNHKALAKVFRAKMLAGLKAANLSVPEAMPAKWVVDCKSVGSGGKALVYLGRYLYRGVIREKDIIACEDGQVTFRYQNSKTKRYEKRTVSGAHFLWLVLQHVLPKGFRRARNFGFLHPNSKTLIKLLQYLLKINPRQFLTLSKPRPPIVCECCGGTMVIYRTSISLCERLKMTAKGSPGIDPAAPKLLPFN